MDPIASLLHVADAFASATALPATTVSRRALNDSSRLDELRSGACDIGTKRHRRVMLWFAENWPSDKDWPPGIERPVRTPFDGEEDRPPRRRRSDAGSRVAA